MCVWFDSKCALVWMKDEYNLLMYRSYGRFVLIHIHFQKHSRKFTANHYLLKFTSWAERGFILDVLHRPHSILIHFQRIENSRRRIYRDSMKFIINVRRIPSEKSNTLNHSANFRFNQVIFVVYGKVLMNCDFHSSNSVRPVPITNSRRVCVCVLSTSTYYEIQSHFQHD